MGNAWHLLCGAPAHAVFYHDVPEFADGVLVVVHAKAVCFGLLQLYSSLLMQCPLKVIFLTYDATPLYS
jgi:hypothetical protein